MKTNKLFAAIAIALFAGSAMADGLSTLSPEFVLAQQSLTAPVTTQALERISNWCAGDAEGWRRRARREERRVASHTSDEQRRHAPQAALQHSCTNSKSALRVQPNQAIPATSADGSIMAGAPVRSVGSGATYVTFPGQSHLLSPEMNKPRHSRLVHLRNSRC